MSQVLVVGPPRLTDDPNTLGRLAVYCQEPDPQQLAVRFEFSTLTAPTVKEMSSSDRDLLNKQILSFPLVVLLGAGARDLLFGAKKGALPFKWRIISNDPAVAAAWSPHPHGTAIWWKRPDNRAEGVEFWSTLYRTACE